MSEDRPAPRLLRANREQFVFRSADLENLIPQDDRARNVWAYVERLDLSAFEEEIRSVEGRPGRPAVDPAILLSVWMLATIEGVGSSRQLATLCDKHDSYAWLCGGVTVEYRTLSDFRVRHEAKLEDLLIKGVAALSHAGLVSMDRVAQDGMRIRASAGAGSFRRKTTLEKHLKEAQAQVKALRAELEHDPAASVRRQKEAHERVATERERRLEAALRAVAEIERRDQKRAAKDGKKKREKQRGGDSAGDGGDATDVREPRASTTDPDARRLHFADGGFRPGYNVQFMSDVDTGVIIGVDVSNSGSDYNKLAPMLEDVVTKLGHKPSEVLVDSGFANHEDIQRVHELGCTVYSPVPKSKSGQSRWAAWRKQRESEAIKDWRSRMETEEGKAIYKRRCEAELVNADARVRGLRAVTVRGTRKVRTVAMLFALVHNMMRSWSLQLA